MSGGAPEPNAKRRRLERTSSRSGAASGAEEEGLTAEEMAAIIASTPEDAPTADSLQAFTSSRLDSPHLSPPDPLNLAVMMAEPSLGMMPVKAEPDMEAAMASGRLRDGDRADAVPMQMIPVPGGTEEDALLPADVKGEESEDWIKTTGAYCAREASLKKEEDAHRLLFECHRNDGDDQHMIWLVGLKNIFARQLPNMPKEYIVRLVLDRSHKSMMIVKNNAVVGGITYRPYLEQHFGEIAFCAITASEQVKGYGTRLMNHLKQHARDVDKLTHFLTYADNNAVGYFSKQGFTKEITLEEERWKGFIKDYDGGTLMELIVDPNLPYTDLPAVIQQQRKAINDKIRELSNCHLVYPGIEFQKNEYGVPRRPLRPEDIPGLKAAGWSPEQSTSLRLRIGSADGPPTRQQLHTFMRSLWRSVQEHQDSWPFHIPVNPLEVADYYDVIKGPIDLRTMARRLDSEGYYLTLDMFVADIRRMFSNARTYNAIDTVYYKIANKLEAFFMGKLKSGLHAVRPITVHMAKAQPVA